MKTIWKSVACRIWLIATPIILAVIITINCLACVTFVDVISLVLGRATTKIVGEELHLYSTSDGVDTKADAVKFGNAVSIDMCEEGFVLLKNNADALPLAAGSKVSVFGKNSVDMAAGGSGSGGGVTAETDIFDSLEASGFEYNVTLTEFYRDDNRSGSGRDANPDDLDSGKEVTFSEGETPLSSYTTDIWNSCNSYKDAAIIVLTRIGGEGFDLPRSSDGSHYLQLSQNEKDLIRAVEDFNFKAVVIVLNTATSLELKEVNDDDGIDAVLWTGFAGGNGMTAFGEILKGETLDGEPLSPSGRTVDTWAADFQNSPVWANFGAALGGDAYTITVGRGVSQEKVYFVDYEEGIYVGYRYYETAYAESVEMGGYYDFVYDEEVVYPFGYGLSYTSFEWTLKNEEEVSGFEWDGGGSLTFEIEVENKGDYPAKDVVQLYVTAPYYGYTDGEGKVFGIEKSAKVLVGFAKTEEIAPGERSTVYITVDSPYDFASYDCYDANANGFKGYEAEHGDYIFSVSTNAHDSVFTVVTTLGEDILYEKDPTTGTTVANLYTDNADPTQNADYELGSVLSRADFVGTWPATRTAEEKKVTADWVASIKTTDPDPNNPYSDGYEMPATAENNGIELFDLIGLSYDDPLWDSFMDQLTLSEMTSLINNGAFHTEVIQRLQVPQTTSSDGPVGFVNFIGASEIYGTCVYPCEVIVASTWSEDCAYMMGIAVGNEGLIGNESGDGAPYSGWYAPGLNIHRSPFGGRNFEYYSEDCYLSGMMTASVVKGCGDRGVYVTMKHFALNEQETHRAVTGVLTWATEQSMREIYLKGFELAVKKVNAYAEENERVIPLGIMSSFNRIGNRWTGGDHRLISTILRDEWGFRGLVISDFNTCDHMVEKDMFYAGGDLDLQMLGVQWTPDKNSASDVAVARQCAKNILYVVANSNAMRGRFEMRLPLWQILLYTADGVVAAGLAAWGVTVILKAFKKKKASDENKSGGVCEE